MSIPVTVLENNILIADFMGVDITPLGLRRNVMVKSYFLPELKYNESWDMLMPVVEKIMATEYDHGEDTAYLRTFGMLSDSKKPLVRFNRCLVYEGLTLIEATYAAVIDFITILNQTNNES